MKKINNILFKFLMLPSLLLFSFNIGVYALDCSAWGVVQDDFQTVFDVLKVVVPVLIIALSSIDFIKAVAGKDEKEIKSAFQRLIKRLALAIVFFFLPVLLSFLLKLFGSTADVCVK